MSSNIVRRCLVAGRVQGVFYRASTQKKAIELGVSGHAINLPDGRVEVLLCGLADRVQAVIDWLWLGPPAAQVTEVAVEEIELSPSEQPSGFRTS